VGILDQVGAILKQYQSGEAGAPGGTAGAAETVVADFDHVASAVPTNTLADGIAHAMRSGATPDFGAAVSSLFAQGNPAQRSAMLSTLVAACGPAAQRILAGAGAGAVPGAGAAASAGAADSTGVPAEQVTEVHPSTVQELANHAQSQDPGIVDKMSAFYAQHPTLVKGLGAVALATVMSRVSQQHRA
jgi:hypothetical protein